jgi:hypothetical protein
MQVKQINTPCTLTPLAQQCRTLLMHTLQAHVRGGINPGPRIIPGPGGVQSAALDVTAVLLSFPARYVHRMCERRNSRQFFLV